MKKWLASLSSAKSTDAKIAYIGTRNAVLDNIRGLFILLFVLWHTSAAMIGQVNFPPIFIHAYNVGSIAIDLWGFNLVDLAPLTFMFVVGLVAFQGFERKYEMVGRRAYRDHFTKSLALCGVFLLARFAEGRNISWSHMTDVAFSMLLLTPFLCGAIRKRAWVKFVVGAALFTIYWLFRIPLFRYFGTSNPGYGGGMAVSVGYVAIVCVVGGMADLMRKKNKLYFVISVLILYGIGWLVLQVFAPMELEQVSRIFEVPTDNPWYGVPLHTQNRALAGLFSVFWMIGGLSKIAVIYLCLWAISTYLLKGKSIWGLSTMGRSLMLYLFLAVLLAGGISMIPRAHFTSVTVPIYIALIVIICLLLTIPLERFKITFKI